MELRVKELRESLGFNLHQMSQYTGVSVNALSNYERGSVPSILQVEKIALACEVSPAWLLGYVDKPQPEVVEKIVIVEKNIGRLPPYWNNDNEGQLIHWK